MIAQKIFFLCALLLLPNLGLAKELRVTTIERVPFVFVEDGEYKGFSVDLWEAIAQDNGWAYTFEEVETFVDLLRAPRTASSDLAIANISITADREEVMDFTSAIFNSGLQIIVTQEHSLEALIHVLVTPRALAILAMLAVIMVVIAHLMWWCERDGRSTIRKTYKGGIIDAAWWTATLGGFGRTLPRTLGGRCALLVWMASMSIGFSLYAATLASTLTTKNIAASINSHHDLQGKTVGTTVGSTSESFLRRNNIDAIAYNNTQILFEDVATGKIDAAVHDAPLVQYYTSHDGSGRVRLINEVFNQDTYGIALPTGSTLRAQINLSLLRLRENGVYDQIYDKWFSIR